MSINNTTMKDGYYLSAYVHIDEFDHVFQIRIRHDQSIALWEKRNNEVKLIHYLEIERRSGIKMHDIAFKDTETFYDLLKSFLYEHGVKIADLNGIWGTPCIDSCNDYHSIEDYPTIAYHSVCHLFSAILSDTDVFYENDIIGFAVDGGPDAVADQDANEKCFYAGCYSHRGNVQMCSIDSPGQLWYYAKKHYNIREGTLMALAEASESEAYGYNQNITRLDRFADFGAAYDLFSDIVNYIDQLKENDKGVRFNGYDSRFSVAENKISMVMKIINTISYDMMCGNIDRLTSKFDIKTSETYLSLSGGFALNCPINSRLMEKYNFKGLLSVPCVSDTGLALGIGLYSFYKKVKNERIHFKLKNAFYGDCASDANFSNKYEFFIKSRDEMDYDQIVADIVAGPIVWFNGAAEIGPRALGNRSILADPRKKETKDMLNAIKKREWWRPIAPIVLENKAKDWFESARSSPYMLQTFTLNPHVAQLVPAIIHMDNSARIQTINSDENPILFGVMESFYAKTDVPILCNTSLNDKGEPIINTCAEAVNFALRKKINVIYINCVRYELYNHEKYDSVSVQERPLGKKFRLSENESADMRNELNPHCVPMDVLKFYRKWPKLINNYEIIDKRDALKLRKYYNMILGNSSSDVFTTD